jgi:DNA helicase-2/ATP-dependent DNA helicase PcrA
MAKNRLLTPDDAALAGEVVGERNLAALYRGYAAELRRAQMVDFDDLLLLAVRLLETEPAVLEAVQHRYRWISVDEYQDVNLAQYRLLRLLASGGANLCVIGDPDQAIYGFRGADRRYFLTFAEDYSGARMLRLRQNYRAPQALLDAAMQVIARNGDREALAVWSSFAEAVKLDLHAAPTDRAEAEYVVHQVEQLVGGTSYFSLDSGRVAGQEPARRSFADFAVLYRLGAQSRLLVEAFDRSGIPYQVIGQTPFFAQKEVRAILACLWLLYNPRARVHFDAVVAQAAGVSPALADQALALVEGGSHAGDALATIAATESPTAAQRRRLERLADFLRGLEGATTSATLVDLIQQVDRFLAGAAGEQASKSRSELVARLLRQAAPFDRRLGDFLEAAALQSAADGFDPRADRVTLMTIHAAKGLEFPVVFVVGCEEGLLPYLPPGRDADVDEERRLFYVGMTRAQQKLLLLRARNRLLFGQRSENAPSRFLADIEDALKAVHAQVPRPPRRDKEDQQLRLF